MRRRNLFISHHSADGALARKLRNCLKAAFLGQHSIFLSEELAAGADWFAELTAFLRKKPITIVLVSVSAMQRSWVWFEVGAGWNAGGVVIPVCTRGVTVERLPDPLRRLQAVNLNPRGLERLLASVATQSNVALDPAMGRAAIKEAFGSVW